MASTTGYMRHIERANNMQASDFLPLTWQDVQIGWVAKDRLTFLARWSENFLVQDGAVLLNLQHDDFKTRTALFKEVSESLRDEGVITQWWGETYPVYKGFSNEVIADIERGACPFFGLRSLGVHMNGYVRKPDGLYLWVAERSLSKQNYPGMLDNMVAGGQSKGLGLKENMQKEAMEEAGIPLEVSRNLVSAGAITYCHQQEHGVKPDTIYVFDLELPESFEPRIVDGEAAGFQLLPVEEVMALVFETDKIKYNCNLVFLDFFTRYGYLNPDEEEHYTALVQGLRR